MATSKTSNQSAQPDDVENKSLEQSAATATLEEEAPEPSTRGNVDVVIAHPLKEGWCGDKPPAKPGDKATIPVGRARELVAAGAARYADQ